MALFGRIYFNAVFGGLGGLLGWLLYAVLYSPDVNALQSWLLGGALIGGNIGFFVVSVDAIRDLSFIRFCRLASYGAVLGGAGGALGMCVAELVNSQMVKILPHLNEWRPLHVVMYMLIRGLGWLVFGVLVGMSEGIAARSLSKWSYGTLGGALGGFVGGALFGLCWYLGPLRASLSGTHHVYGDLFGASALVLLGACIGALSALVQEMFKPASVRVLRGWQEGREYALAKKDNLLGRDEHADIALFRDMLVEKKHAIIQRESNRYVLVNNDSPSEQTLVNDHPVPNCQDLQDGDRIQLGRIVLRFQLRAAKGMKG